MTKSEPVESLISLRQIFNVQLDSEDLEEFKLIAKEDFGVELTGDELIDQATRAVVLAKLIQNDYLVYSVDNHLNKVDNQ